MIEIGQCEKEVKALLGKPIVLVGMMGVGKTTVGRLLASRLKMSFYDSDDEIVRSVGKSISDIFSEDGEPAFREIERETIRHLLSNGPCVISSGGGGITIPETAYAIMSRSLCLWIDAPVPVLVTRTEGSDRPLLKHGEPAEVLQTILDKRRAAYGQAHIHVLDDGLTPEEMVDRILLQIREYLYAHGSEADKESHVPDAMCLTVSLGDRSYPIFIGSGLLEQVEMWLPNDLEKRDAFVMTDYNVREHITDRFCEKLRPFMRSVSVMELPPGEQTKSFERYQSVMEWMVEQGVKRDSVVFSVGGGVIGDLAGFASATVLRGVAFIQIPTTLLSQVDSSVGGKTGINSRTVKNMVGAFYQPRCVVIDLDTLKTLPQREILAGYAEIVKYGLIGDEEFFEWLEENGTFIIDGSAPETIRGIETGCNMKAEIVEQDEREESGRRALLNFGHTFGHALEALAGYDGTLLHGEGVAIGMVLAARLSQRLGYLDQKDVARIKAHLESVGMKTEIGAVPFKQGVTPQMILDLMRKDKKAGVGGITFVVLRKIGEAINQPGVDDSVVLELLTESLNAGVTRG